MHPDFILARRNGLEFGGRAIDSEEASRCSERIKGDLQSLCGQGGVFSPLSSSLTWWEDKEMKSSERG
jgi:hypothetical protein